MRQTALITSLALIALATASLAQQATTTENGLCVQNVSDKAHFFAVDNGVERRTGVLASREVLCTPETATPQNGFVSVFESAETLEGCSRLVTVGTIEGLVRYADFDRCEWSSHSGN